MVSLCCLHVSVILQGFDWTQLRGLRISCCYRFSIFPTDLIYWSPTNFIQHFLITYHHFTFLRISQLTVFHRTIFSSSSLSQEKFAETKNLSAKRSVASLPKLCLRRPGLPPGTNPIAQHQPSVHSTSSFYGYTQRWLIIWAASISQIQTQSSNNFFRSGLKISTSSSRTDYMKNRSTK